MLSFLERHAERIAGVIGCFDRVIITGTIPGSCYAQGMTDYLKFRRIRVFDYKQWAKPLREEVRANARRLAQIIRIEPTANDVSFFRGDAAEWFRTLLRGEFNISGFRNRDLRVHLHDKTPYQVSRFLKRLRKHGPVKKIGKAYKYYLTNLGRRVAAVALKLKEMFIIPALRGLLLEEVKIL